MATRLIRVTEAAKRLGYRPSYGRDVIPQLVPTYQVSAAPNAPRLVREDELDAFIASLADQPGATTPEAKAGSA